MAAPRAIQFIALRNLSRSSQQQVRGLRMTVPVTRAPSKVKREHAAIAARTSVAETRQFTTTQAQQASRDSSTIDFFFFPEIDHEVDPASELIRVPILPDNYNPPRTGAHAPEAEVVVHKPLINAMSMDSVILPFSESHDGHSLGVDFHAMADRVAQNVRSLKVPVEEKASMMKQLWNDMVDDVLGITNKKATA